MKVTTTKYKDKATGFVGTLVTTESHQGCTAGLYALNGDMVAYVPNHCDPYFLTVKQARASCIRKAKAVKMIPCPKELKSPDFPQLTAVFKSWGMGKTFRFGRKAK